MSRAEISIVAGQSDAVLSQARLPITRADLLDAREVADLVRVDRRTILRWALEGTIPSIKRGRRVLFLRAQVEQWLLDGSRGQTL